MDTISFLLQKSLSENRDRTALIHISAARTTRKITYAELDSESSRAAHILQKAGIRTGSHVVICLTDSFLLRCYFLGALRLGAVPCAVFPGLGEGGLKTRLEGCDAALLVDDAFVKAHPADEEAPDFPWHISGNEDPAFQIFTSGTTGQPKAVVHLQRIGSAIERSMRDILHASPDDIYWCTAHPAWITGTVYGIIGPLITGMCSVAYDGAFHAKRWMPILQDQGVTLWYTAPSALRGLMREDADFFKGFDLSSLKQIYSIGEPLPADVYEWGRETFRQPVYDTWFQTETGTIRIANQPGSPVIPGKMGRAVDDTRCLVLDDNGEPCAPGAIGKLWLRCGWDSCFLEYWHRPEDTEAKFRNGLFCTGDAVRTDEGGLFTFEGRADDVINTSGHLVGPFEIESALLQAEEVIDAAVIAEKDPLAYEKPAAFLVLAPGCEWSRELELKLRKTVTNAIAAYAVPAHFHISEFLPKTASGKTDRGALKSRNL